MQTDIEPPRATTGDVTAAAERLAALRARRAESRRAARAVVDAMAATATAYLAGVFSTNDPITGHPACLLIKSGDRLDDEYERQSPRPIPDSPNRLTMEILGRVLTVDVDDFGWVSITGLSGTADLHRARVQGDDVAFASDDGADTTHFTSLLTRLIDGVYDDEFRAARRLEPNENA